MAARSLKPAASLQGCGGRGRGGLLAPKGGNDKEMKELLFHLAPVAGRGEKTRLALCLRAAGIRRAGRDAELALQHRDPRFQRLVLLARQARHVLDRLELLALDDIEVAQNLFGLVAPERIDLALDPLGCARGIVHQPSDLVEKPIGRLRHGDISCAGTETRKWRSRRLHSRPSQGRYCRSPCHAPLSLQSY